MAKRKVFTVLQAQPHVTGCACNPCIQFRVTQLNRLVDQGVTLVSKIMSDTKTEIPEKTIEKHPPKQRKIKV